MEIKVSSHGKLIINKILSFPSVRILSICIGLDSVTLMYVHKYHWK